MRINLDQTIGDKFTVSGGVDVAHNFTQDGIGNNDNAGISPIYTFGYAPAIYDLQQDRSADRPSRGHVDERRRHRNVESVRVRHAISERRRHVAPDRQRAPRLLAASTVHNTVQLTYIGGVDRFQFSRAQQYLAELPAVRAGRRIPRHVADQHDREPQHQPERQRRLDLQPGREVAQLGADVGRRHVRDAACLSNYFVRQRGLTPTRRDGHGGRQSTIYDQIVPSSATSRTTSTSRSSLLDEKLALSVGVRADRWQRERRSREVLRLPEVLGELSLRRAAQRFTSADRRGEVPRVVRPVGQPARTTATISD